MANVTVSSDIHQFMQSADYAAARSALLLEDTFLPLTGGMMNSGAEIRFDNYAKIRQTPNDYGLDQVCSIDYVHRWKNGSLYIMDQSSGIRSVQYGLTITPTGYFDITQGYLVGSRYTKDDGTVFECTDNTASAAVWVEVATSVAEITSSTPTTLTGLLKGNGSVVSAATAGTDYAVGNHGHTTSGSLGIVIDGAGSVISAGVKGYLKVPYNCTITSSEIVAKETGSIVIDIWRDTYANFPPTDADSITASATPTLSSAQKSQDLTLTNWAASLTGGHYLAFNVDSVTGVTQATLTLNITRSI